MTWIIVFDIIEEPFYSNSSSIMRSENIIKSLIKSIGMENFEAEWMSQPYLMHDKKVLCIVVHDEDDVLAIRLMHAPDILFVIEDMDYETVVDD